MENVRKKAAATAGLLILTVLLFTIILLASSCEAFGIFTPNGFRKMLNEYGVSPNIVSVHEIDFPARYMVSDINDTTYVIGNRRIEVFNNADFSSTNIVHTLPYDINGADSDSERYPWYLFSTTTNEVLFFPATGWKISLGSSPQFLGTPEAYTGRNTLHYTETDTDTFTHVYMDGANSHIVFDVYSPDFYNSPTTYPKSQNPDTTPLELPSYNMLSTTYEDSNSTIVVVYLNDDQSLTILKTSIATISTASFDSREDIQLSGTSFDTNNINHEAIRYSQYGYILPTYGGFSSGASYMLFKADGSFMETVGSDEDYIAMSKTQAVCYLLLEANDSGKVPKTVIGYRMD